VLALLQLLPQAPAWFPDYLIVLSLLLGVFVVFMKILIHRQPHRNYLLAGSFTATLLLLGARGMLGV